MVIAVKQQIDNAGINEAVLEERMVRLGFCDADRICTPEPKFIYHAEKLYPHAGYALDGGGAPEALASGPPVETRARGFKGSPLRAGKERIDEDPSD